MAAIEACEQRAKREFDRQLGEELEGTFPASDPPKVTRFSIRSRGSQTDENRPTRPKAEG